MSNIGGKLSLANLIGLFSYFLESFLILFECFCFKQSCNVKRLLANGIFHVTSDAQQGLIKLFGR